MARYNLSAVHTLTNKLYFCFRGYERWTVTPSGLLRRKIANMKMIRAGRMFVGSLAAPQGKLETQFDSETQFRVPIDFSNNKEFEGRARRR